METARERLKLSALQRVIVVKKVSNREKRFSEADGLYKQNLAMAFLNFKNNTLGRPLKPGITKTVNKQWTCYKCTQNPIAFPLRCSEDPQREKKMNLFIYFYQIVRLHLKHWSPFVIVHSVSVACHTMITYYHTNVYAKYN